MKIFILSAIILAILGGTACCVFIGKDDDSNVVQQEMKDADPRAAEFMLRNLADAMKMHSTQHGGGGFSKFANDLTQLDGLCANKIKPALPGPAQTSFFGYIVRLEENPGGDNFENNFRIIAYPANGYQGETFMIDKNEKINKYNQEGI